MREEPETSEVSISRGKRNKRDNIVGQKPQDCMCMEKEVRRDEWRETLGNDHCLEMDLMAIGAEFCSPVKHRQG